MQSLNGRFVGFGFVRKDSLTQIASTLLTTLGFCLNLLVKQIVTDIIILIDYNINLECVIIVGEINNNEVEIEKLK